MNSLRRRAWFATAFLLGAAFLIFAPAIPQDPAYHSFADRNSLGAIPNVWNTVSNLPFLVVGILGLCACRKAEGWGWRILFTGVLLTAFGSAYYHLWPNDRTLVWDRLPMAIAFTALVSIVVSELCDARTGQRLLLPLVALGAGSVAWWALTNDLRPYILAQFGSILVILCALPASSKIRRIWPVLAFYALAKAAERYDAQIYRTLLISGHTLKHLLAAGATAFLIRWQAFLVETLPAELEVAPSPSRALF